MALAVLPSVYPILRAGLLAEPEVFAITEHIYAERLPAELVLPAVRMTRVGGTADDVQAIDSPIVQFDCFAEVDDEPTADRLARTVQASLVDMAERRYTLGDARIVGVEPQLGPYNQPDTTRDETPLPRFLLRAYVHVQAATPEAP